MSLDITVTGGSRRLHLSWEEAAAAWAGKAGPLAREALRARAPVSKGLDPKGPQPGRLRDSISYRTEGGGGQMTVVLYATVPYARFVLKGTSPHPITARNARALHWVDGGGDHFARSVKHPGTRPNPFPELAISSIRPVLAELFARACQEAIR